MPFWHVHGSFEFQRNFRHAAAQISIVLPQNDPRAACRKPVCRSVEGKSAGQSWIVAVIALVAGAPIGGLIAAARRGAARGHGAFVAFQRPRTARRNAAQFRPARD